jgi:hypothetical protein
MKMFLILTMLGFGFTANASATRALDGQVITNGAATLTLPTSTDTLVGKATPDSLTNKLISGATNTLSAIPVSAIGGGSVLSGTNTGDVTLGTANGLGLAGQALSLSAASTSTTGALTSTDWNTFSGKLTSPLTTKGDTLGYSTVPARVPVGSDGQILTADSTQALGLKWAAAPSVGPNVSGSQASPTAITAAGGISFSGSAYSNISFITGSGGPVTVTATPQISAGSLAGQKLVLISESATNTVKLQDGNGLALNGAWVGGLNSVITLLWDGSVWVEESRR